MKSSVFFSRLFFLVLLCGYGVVLCAQSFQPSAPPIEEGQTGVPFATLYVLVADVESGLETFDGKLSYIKSKNPRAFSNLMNAWREMKNSVGAIPRDATSAEVNDVYDKLAYMPCSDIDQPGSPVYKKLLFIKGTSLESYTALITELKSTRYCTNGRIARDVVEARVHAVYVRVTLVWLSASSFYYAKRFAQTTYTWLTTSLIPGVSSLLTSSYAYVKCYGAQVLEKNRQRQRTSGRLQHQIKQVSPAESMDTVLPSTAAPVEQRTISTPPVERPVNPVQKKRRYYNPNAKGFI